MYWDQEELFGGKNQIKKISWDCTFKISVLVFSCDNISDYVQRQLD